MYIDNFVGFFKSENGGIWHKYSLSIEEAAEYYGIGEKRLRRLAYEHEGDNFLLEVGNRIRFKRKLFEDYLDVAAMV